MVYVQMMATAQLCVHVTVTGRVVNVRVSFFHVLYDVITMSNVCLFYTLRKKSTTPSEQFKAITGQS